MAQLDELLMTVQKPARYIGGEWNMVKKEWADIMVKVLVAFPDIYEVGMSYLGLKILYGIINSRSDSLCERVFSPWPDFENVMRANSIRIFSIESGRPVSDFDIIGFSLAYELNYTNVLNILDLAGIPKLSAERRDHDPLIIAGGPASYNPEPMADFIDAFVIGEGEEVMGEIIDVYKDFKTIRAPSAERLTTNHGRRELLKSLAKLDGVYVPSLYRFEYNEDRTIKVFSPLEDGIPARVKKRFVKDFENSFYPVDQIVPYLPVVHDRITLEIMRGCRHACKFCLAGAAYRPWRIRSMERILNLARDSYANTGYEEMSLLSLSSGDHPDIREIISGLNDIFRGKAVSISVPSLRVEDTLVNLPILISKVRKTTLTFAPESGSECLRRFINKDIDMRDLFKAAEESFKSGWKGVKLYFMIGLPSETDEDILSIGRLMEDISNLRKAINGQKARITASINAFVPKPHTPFQRETMSPLIDLSRKRDVLKKHVGSMSISRSAELDFNPFERSSIEAIFSTGDRRLGRVIHEAWKAGARLDSWSDFFKLELWLEAFRRSGVDPDYYLTRRRSDKEILPWSVIDVTL